MGQADRLFQIDGYICHVVWGHERLTYLAVVIATVKFCIVVPLLPGSRTPLSFLPLAIHRLGLLFINGPALPLCVHKKVVENV